MATYGTIVRYGLATVRRGSVVVTGEATTWASGPLAARAGDEFRLAGLSELVAEVFSDTEMSLELPWSGEDQDDVAYVLRLNAPSRSTPAGVAASLAEANTALQYVSQYALNLPCIAFDVDAPPDFPAPKDHYLIGHSPMGAWAGRPQELAMWTGSTWFIRPGQPSDSIVSAATGDIRVLNEAGVWVSLGVSASAGPDRAAVQEMRDEVITATSAAIAAAANTTANLDGGPVFLTEAELLAYAPSDRKPATLAFDSGLRLRGVYRRTAGAWPTTRESDTLPGVETRLYSYQADVSTRFTSMSDRGANLMVYDGDVLVIAAASDGLLLGVDPATGDPLGSVVDRIVSPPRWYNAARQSVGAIMETLQVYTGQDVFVIAADPTGLLLGADYATGRAVGSLADDLRGSGGSSYDPRWSTTTALTPIPYGGRVIGALAYGQSRGVGATAQPPLSIDQPYSNLTFAGGPKSAVGTGTSASKPLVEDSLGENGASGTNRGETPCSGMANWCVQTAAAEAAVDPADLIIFSSAPGQGGSRINELWRGTIPYTRLLGHVSAAKALANAAGKGYVVAAVAFSQGESNADYGSPRATNAAQLVQLSTQLDEDIRAITGQAEPVRLLIDQITYKATSTNGAIALSQLDAVAASPLIHLVSPIYHLPYSSDGTHLTNSSTLRLGRAFGRALKQIIIDGREPDCIWPVSATVRGTRLSIQFRAPTPLKIDASALAPTADFGFRVLDDAGVVGLTNITTTGWTVTMSLARALGATPRVRYALDALGTGLTILGGASGNLRDTTPGEHRVDGVTYPNWFVAPAFELNVLKLDPTS